MSRHHGHFGQTNGRITNTIPPHTHKHTNNTNTGSWAYYNNQAYAQRQNKYKHTPILLSFIWLILAQLQSKWFQWSWWCSTFFYLHTLRDPDKMGKAFHFFGSAPFDLFFFLFTQYSPITCFVYSHKHEGTQLFPFFFIKTSFDLFLFLFPHYLSITYFVYLHEHEGMKLSPFLNKNIITSIAKFSFIVLLVKKCSLGSNGKDPNGIINS